MAKGGARTRSGPAPDPEALRREWDEGDWTVLPAEGREGDPPPWPLKDQSDREVELWAQLWTKPQALMWERYGQQLEVALYVRNVGLVEQPGSPVNLGTLVRQQSDSLGLTTPGMRANRWKIGRPADEDQAPTQPVGPAVASSGQPRQSARDRLKVLHGGAA